MTNPSALTEEGEQRNHRRKVMDTPIVDSSIKEGAVFCPRKDSGQTHRRVIGVIQGRVVYCFGGDKNRVCKLKTFLKWAKPV
jgi:hypothetical protein